MPYLRMVIGIPLVGLTFALSVSSAALEEHRGKPVPHAIVSQSQESAADPASPAYQPPRRGVPKGRVAGGTRRGEDERICREFSWLCRKF
jgi:hypothetical protein